ncbi:MAG: hypothetical protein HY080_07215 [Gammaproteobacteria bacterium]|nr:hypothetical protein [Gammaproteobacteria bacterium]
MLDWAKYTLGVHAEELLLDSMEANRLASLALIQQANNSLEIFSRDLEPRLYDNSDFVSAVRAMALRNQRIRVRILVNEPDHAIKHDHRLIHIARHLSSYIEIRKTHEDFAMNPSAFVVVDARGVLYRSLARRYEGSVNFNDPLKSGELLQFFNEAWNHSRQYTEFRRLYI